MNTYKINHTPFLKKSKMLPMRKMPGVFGRLPHGEHFVYGDYFPGLKLSFKLTERLNTKCSAEESLLSGQK